ncbi:TPA: hypothetical protein O7142_003955 [Salmonella enterica]|nr:hypothetical protein [Salmonella enterica subsp. diarizonae]HDC2661436.1 hypothetical protein [Salmonella enterica]
MNLENNLKNKFRESEGQRVINRSKPGMLIPGNVKPEYFNILVEICKIKNPNMIQALADVLICGGTRKDACMKNNVAMSNFSVNVRRLQGVSIHINGVCETCDIKEESLHKNCLCNQA